MVRPDRQWEQPHHSWGNRVRMASNTGGALSCLAQSMCCATHGPDWCRCLGSNTCCLTMFDHAWAAAQAAFGLSRDDIAKLDAGGKLYVRMPRAKKGACPTKER